MLELRNTKEINTTLNYWKILFCCKVSFIYERASGSRKEKVKIRRQVELINFLPWGENIGELFSRTRSLVKDSSKEKYGVMKQRGFRKGRGNVGNGSSGPCKEHGLPSGKHVLMWKGDGHVFLDASSGYTVRLRVRVASQGGCPGKVWGLLHTISQRFSPGQGSQLAPKGPFQPEPLCALWRLWEGVIMEKMAISILRGERCEEHFSKKWVNANKKAICQSRERLTGMGPA